MPSWHFLTISELPQSVCILFLLSVVISYTKEVAVAWVSSGRNSSTGSCSSSPFLAQKHNTGKIASKAVWLCCYKYKCGKPCILIIHSSSLHSSISLWQITVSMNPRKGVAEIASLTLRHKITAAAIMPAEKQFVDKQMQWVREYYLAQVGGSNDFGFFRSSSHVNVLLWDVSLGRWILGSAPQSQCNNGL